MGLQFADARGLFLGAQLREHVGGIDAEFRGDAERGGGAVARHDAGAQAELVAQLGERIGGAGFDLVAQGEETDDRIAAGNPHERVAVALGGVGGLAQRAGRGGGGIGGSDEILAPDADASALDGAFDAAACEFAGIGRGGRRRRCAFGGDGIRILHDGARGG